MAKKTNESERRHFIRHPMCFPLKYKVIKEGPERKVKEGRSTTINIGRGGLMFSAKHFVEVNSLIVVQIPFEEKVFNVKAKVVHCTKTADSKLYNVGVCFLRFNEAFKVKLIEQMYLISEYRDLRSIQLGREVSLQEASKEWIKRYSKRFQRLYW